MAEGLSAAGVNSTLDYIAGTLYTAWWFQLHTGAPGSAGTSNVAGNNTRQQLSSWASAASQSKASSAGLTWTSVSTAETYSKHSVWSASSAGTFQWSGSVSASAVNVGDTFTIPSGSATVSMTAAS